MATETQSDRLGAPMAIAGGTSRVCGVAFRTAHRHSRRVSLLRIALPVAAVCLFGAYGLLVRLSVGIGSSGGELKVSMPSMVGENLVMSNPEYHGFGKDGSRFVVRSRTASQDIRQTKPIALEGIEARMLQPDGTLAVLRSDRGTYVTASGVLELFDDVRVDSDNGMRARLTKATVATKEGRVVSTDPVQLLTPTGEVRGARMVLLQKQRQVALTDGVTARFVPSQDSARKTSEGPRALGASSGPVDIVSQRLDLDDVKKIAVFSGGVTAVQGDARLETPELEAHYDGAAGGGGAPVSGGDPITKEAPAATPADPTQGKLKRLVANNGVVLTRGSDVARSRKAEFDVAGETAVLDGGVLLTSAPDRQATGERAEIDLKSERSRLIGSVVVTTGDDRRATADSAEIDQRNDTALLLGRVVVTQGPNVLRGGRLTLDRKAGTSDLSTPGGRISARFQRTDGRSGPALRSPEKGTENAVAGLSFQTDPNAPIDVEADTLTASDKAKTAIFRGDVRVVQGAFTIRAPELTAVYSGQAAIAADGTKQAGGGTQLERIKATRKVLITSGSDQSVVGDWAEFDTRSNTAVIGGNVVLSQGRNVVRGQKLVIDMVTGKSRMETVPGVATSPGAAWSTSATAAPGPSSDAPGAPASGGVPKDICKGRMCAVFYPKDIRERSEQMKARQKERRPAATPGGAGAATGPSSGATSSWDASSMSEAGRRSN